MQPCNVKWLLPLLQRYNCVSAFSVIAFYQLKSERGKMTLQERLTLAFFPYPTQYCHTLSLWIGYKFLQTAHVHQSNFYCLPLCPSSVVLICEWQRYQPVFLPPAVSWAAWHIFQEGLSALSNSFSAGRRGRWLHKLASIHRSLRSNIAYAAFQNRTAFLEQL